MQISVLESDWGEAVRCELASIFTLRRMGERWRTEAPYTNWTSYSESLAVYAESLVEKRSGLPTASFGAWWSANEETESSFRIWTGSRHERGGHNHEHQRLVSHTPNRIRTSF